jgi:hypothetical protein
MTGLRSVISRKGHVDSFLGMVARTLSSNMSRIEHHGAQEPLRSETLGIKTYQDQDPPVRTVFKQK